jgi:hypothetical protein
MPANLTGIEDRSLDARSFIIPFPIGLIDFGDTGKADPDPARHGSFQRDFARYLIISSEARDGLHHRFRTAASDSFAQCISIEQRGEQIGHTSLDPEGSVLGCDMNVAAGGLKLRKTGQIILGSGTIAKRYAFREWLHPMLESKRPLAKSRVGKGKHRSLPNPTRYQD